MSEAPSLRSEIAELSRGTPNNVNKMHPEICRLGPITIYSYGLLFAAGLLICLILSARQAKRQGLKESLIYDLFFWIIASGVIGARTVYVLINLDYFLSNPPEIFMFTRGGLSWFGGFSGGLIAVIVFARKRKLGFFLFADLLAPYLALGQSIGRLGCFLNGCCHGRATDFFLSVEFPFLSYPVHPTQLYSSLGLFFIFLLLVRFREKRTFAFQGGLFAAYLILVGTLRFFLEFLREDAIQTPLGVSLFQLFSLAIIILGTALFLKIKAVNEKI